MLAGFDVKKSEIHGMSQRGGSVVSHVRFGKKVYSPIIPEGEGDVLFGFELMETCRALPLLRTGAGSSPTTCRSRRRRSRSGQELSRRYPPAKIAEPFPDSLLVDGQDLADEAGNPRTANTVLLGARLQTARIGGESLAAGPGKDGARSAFWKKTSRPSPSVQ